MDGARERTGGCAPGEGRPGGVRCPPSGDPGAPSMSLVPPPSWSRLVRAALPLLLMGTVAVAAEPPPLPAFDLERLTVTPTARAALLGSSGLLLEPGALR